jgi:hypothetical protein
MIRPPFIYTRHGPGRICVPWRTALLALVFDATTSPMLTPKLVALEILDHAMDLCKSAVRRRLSYRRCSCGELCAGVTIARLRFDLGARRISTLRHLDRHAFPVVSGRTAKNSSSALASLMRKLSNDSVKRLLTIFMACVHRTRASPSDVLMCACAAERRDDDPGAAQDIPSRPGHPEPLCEAAFSNSCR